MLGKRLKGLALEAEDDGLAVTAAILNAEHKSDITEPEDVSRMADEIRNLEVAEDLNEDRENPNQSDAGDPVSTDLMIDDIDNSSENENKEIDPSKAVEEDQQSPANEIQEGADDVQAVESLMERVVDQSLSTEDFKVLSKLTQKYLPEEFKGYAQESFDMNYGIERLKALVAAIWRMIISSVTKVIEMGRVAIDVHNSKLRLAHEDIYEIKKNAGKIRGKTSSQTVLDNAYHRTLIVGEFRSARDVAMGVAYIDKVYKSYFEHARINVPQYFDSVEAFLAQDDAFKDGYVVEETQSGSRSVNISGTVRITKDTVPGFLKVVPEIPGIKRSFDDAIQLKSSTLPGGLIIAAWVPRDSTVTTGVDSDVLRSKMILTSDQDYDVENTQLPVMTYNELVVFLDSLDKVTTTLQNGETVALAYNRSLVALRKRLVELQRHATVLESDVNAQGYEYIVQYKRRLANTTARLVQTTENFYGTPTRAMMMWGNRYLSFALKYANAVTAAYLVADNTGKLPKPKAQPSF